MTFFIVSRLGKVLSFSYGLMFRSNMNNPIPGLSGPACMLAKGWSGGRGHPPDIGRGCSRPGSPKEIDVI